MNKFSITRHLTFAACLFAVAVLATGEVQADTVIGLTGNDGASSTPLQAGNSLANLLSDPFAFDPQDPTSPNPDITYTEATGWHGNEADSQDITLVFTLNYTVSALDAELVFDAWGRNGNGGNRFNRDDDYDVQLFSGATLVAEVLGEGIPDANTTRHNRTSFAGIAAGTTIDQLVIAAHDSNGAPGDGGVNNFTLQEVRFSALSVPEPSSVALISVVVLGCFVRRRKN